MSRRNKPKVLNKDATVEETKVAEVVTETEVVNETEPVKEEVVETVAEVVEAKPEVVTANTGGIEVESKNLSQEQAEELAGSVKSAQEKIQDTMLLEKQKGAVRQYAFSIYNSMLMGGVAFGSSANREKFIKLSIEAAKDFIKHSKDIDMDGVL